MSSTPLHNQFIATDCATTLPALFAERVRRSPEAVAYQQFDSSSNCWRHYTWREVQNEVSRWHHALSQTGLAAGERVAIMLKNSVEWVCFDQAAQALGLVVVSLYTSDSRDDIVYILNDAGARLLLLASSQPWQALSLSASSLPSLQHLWCLHNNTSSTEEQTIRTVQSQLPDTPSPYKPIPSRPDDLATIIYTSGTTGRPKGVMLSHRQLLANAEAVQQQVPAYANDIFLSFLPMTHAFERTAEYILPMMAGSQVAYARSVKLLRQDLMQIRPTIFLAVPRLYEKIYTTLQQAISTSAVKRWLFHWTVQLGWQHFEASYRRRPPLNPIQRSLYWLLHRLVANQVLQHLGGRLRLAITGAAPMPKAVMRFFIGLGLPLYEGYGLTEAAPVVCSNHPGSNHPGTVGVPLPGVSVKLASDGELLVRSPSIMRGYWHNAKASQQAVDADGWLHTGDLAEIDNGVISIVGRKKDILVTSTGEKVAPSDMESTIVLDPLFEQALIIGEGKPYLSALLILNLAEWQQLATSLQLNPDAPQALHNRSVIHKILQRLASLLAGFPGYAQVHAVALSLEPWTIDNGLLTPTMKLKRAEIEKRFAADIRQLYRGHAYVE